MTDKIRAGLVWASDERKGKAMAESRESVPMGPREGAEQDEPRREMGDLKGAGPLDRRAGRARAQRGGPGRRRLGSWTARGAGAPPGELGAERVDCVVVDGYDDADELVAMMATDDKLRLGRGGPAAPADA